MIREIIKCLICKKIIRDPFFKKVNGYSYVFCNHCGGATLVPRNKAIEDLEKIYDSEYFDWREAKGAKKFIYRLTLFKSYTDWVSAKTREGKVLDVGAGTPAFVKEMQVKGWDVYALELSPVQVRKIGKVIGTKKVYHGYFEKIRLPNNFFDALTFWHVLEHVKYPIQTIGKAGRVLKRGGRIYFEVPNVNSLAWRIFGNYYDLLRLPEHLFYFSAQSMKVLLKNMGFKVLEVSYPLKLNSTFSASFSKFVKEKTNSSRFALWSFYLALPLSFFLSFSSSLFGQSEILRVSAVKN